VVKSGLKIFFLLHLAESVTHSVHTAINTPRPCFQLFIQFCFVILHLTHHILTRIFFQSMCLRWLIYGNSFKPFEIHVTLEDLKNLVAPNMPKMTIWGMLSYPKHWEKAHNSMIGKTNSTLSRHPCLHATAPRLGITDILNPIKGLREHYTIQKSILEEDMLTQHQLASSNQCSCFYLVLTECVTDLD
jgi:hypothetical protein